MSLTALAANIGCSDWPVLLNVVLAITVLVLGVLLWRSKRTKQPTRLVDSENAFRNLARARGHPVD